MIKFNTEHNAMQLPICFVIGFHFKDDERWKMKTPTLLIFLRPLEFNFWKKNKLSYKEIHGNLKFAGSFILSSYFLFVI